MPRWTYRAGVNSVGGYDTADELKAAGFTLVREPFTWDRIQKDPVATYDWRSVDASVKKLSDAGFKILLDCHQSQWSKAFFSYAVGFPTWLYPQAKGDTERGGAEEAKAAFYRNEHSYGATLALKPWKLYGDLLAACAERYAHEPAVVGLDIINEPGFGGSADMPEGSTLARFYERMAARVAEHAPEWWLICENGTWANIARDEAPFKTAADWPKVPKLVCSAHFYPDPRSMKKGETEDAAAARWLSLLAEQAAMAEALGVPFYVGEHAAFGATDTGQGDNPMHWQNWPRHTERLSRWLKTEGHAWSYWAWQKGAGPTLMGDNGHLRADILKAMAPALK